MAARHRQLTSRNRPRDPEACRRLPRRAQRVPRHHRRPRQEGARRPRRPAGDPRRGRTDARGATRARQARPSEEGQPKEPTLNGSSSPRMHPARRTRVPPHGCPHASACGTPNAGVHAPPKAERSEAGASCQRPPSTPKEVAAAVTAQTRGPTLRSGALKSTHAASEPGSPIFRGGSLTTSRDSFASDSVSASQSASNDPPAARSSSSRCRRTSSMIGSPGFGSVTVRAP